MSQLTGSYTEVEPEIKKDTLFKSIPGDLYLPAHQILTNCNGRLANPLGLIFIRGRLASVYVSNCKRISPH